MGAKTLSKDELNAKAWRRWWTKNYSWEGLAQHRWGAAKTLQDYWLSDPETGHIRSENELLKSGELIVVADQPTFHICHLPLNYADGTPTPKSTNPDMAQAQMASIFHARLIAAAIDSEDASAIAAVKARFDGTSCLNVDLSKDNFSPALNASFENAIISGKANFFNANISAGANFDNVTFFHDARFTNVTFSDYASFDDATFSANSNFSDTTFSSYAHFDTATFLGKARFSRASISGYASFDDATFFDEASFYGNTFSSKVSFGGTVFSSRVGFNRTSFSSDASFDNASFSDDARFNNTTFSNGAFFSNSTFSSSIHFDSAFFSGDTRFNGCTFKKGLKFAGCRFVKQTHFSNLTWPDDHAHNQGAFRDAIFKELANFGGSGFRAFAAFEGARFHNGLRLDKSSKADDDGTSIDFEARARRTFNRELQACMAVIDPTEREQHLETLEAGCRTLRNEMIKQADKNREQLLYKFELLARREQNSTHRVEKWFSYTYDWLADYGGSPSRPLAWLGGLFLAFSLIYSTFLFSLHPPHFAPQSYNPTAQATTGTCAAAIPLPAKTTDIAQLSLSLSASRIFPFGGFEDVSKRLATAYDCEGMSLRAFGFRCLATLQSFFALTLAFLFGLSVRRRFQIS